MDFIIDAITEWIKDFLIEAITGNLSNMFGDVNTKVATIAGEVGKTPEQWNSGVFSMIHSLSESVIVPIAGLVIAAVLSYELIRMVIDRNNMHDFDTFIFFKWIIKAGIAAYVVSHTFDFMGGIHPLLYLFVTALIALVAWIPYMYVMAKVPKAGVVLIMNLFVAIAFVAFGELANLLLGSLIVCSILAEIIRKWAGYKNYKGIVMSYILLSLSNIGSPLYVWVFSDYAISEASEEMSANYAEILSTLTSPWFMVLAIAATVVISIIVGVIAKKVYNKQFANAGIM